MTKGTKIVLIIASICIALSIIVFSAAVFLGGSDFRNGIDTEIFGVNVHMGKEGVFAGPADLESTGYENTAEFTESINAIEVNWTSGEVKFEFGSENITVRESSNGIIDDKNVMVCSVENGTLKVHYHAPRVNIVSLGDVHDKNLTVTIPEHLAAGIKVIKVDSTSADVTLSSFELDRLTIDSTSGCGFVSDVSAGDFIFGSTSGDLTVERCSFGSLNAHTTSGCVTLTEISSGYAGFDVISGDVTAESCSFGKVEAESTSGNISMSLNSVPAEFDADSTSGDVEIFLPEDAEFELEFDPTSGELVLEFAAIMHGDEYIVGNGRNEISIESTSGDAYIRVK